MLAKTVILSLSLIIIANSATYRGGILYPRESEYWYKKSLKEVVHVDFFHKIVQKILQLTDMEVDLMPVPSSYNDITMSWKIRDHVGLAWYNRKFFIPKSWHQIGRVWFRFGSVSYASQVWINGQLVMSHEMGHLPILAEITNFLRYGKENLVTVTCNNTLLSDTVPQGKVEKLKTGRLSQSYSFDFFNYDLEPPLIPPDINNPPSTSMIGGQIEEKKIHDNIVPLDIHNQPSTSNHNIITKNNYSHDDDDVEIIDDEEDCSLIPKENKEAKIPAMENMKTIEEEPKNAIFPLIPKSKRKDWKLLKKLYDTEPATKKRRHEALLDKFGKEMTKNYNLANEREKLINLQLKRMEVRRKMLLRQRKNIWIEKKAYLQYAAKLGVNLN